MLSRFMFGLSPSHNMCCQVPQLSHWIMLSVSLFTPQTHFVMYSLGWGTLVDFLLVTFFCICLRVFQSSSWSEEQNLCTVVEQLLHFLRGLFGEHPFWRQTTQFGSSVLKGNIEYIVSFASGCCVYFLKKHFYIKIYIAQKKNSCKKILLTNSNHLTSK